MRRTVGRSAERYVNRLLRGKRPGSFTPTDEEAALVTAAIELKAADPEGAAPRPEFVDALRERLAVAEAEAAPDAHPLRATARPSRNAPSTASLSSTSGASDARHLRRRWMLAAGALTATGVAAGAVAERLVGPGAPSTPDAGPQQTAVISPTAGTWQSVAASTDLTQTNVLSFDLGAVSGFLYRADGRVRAVSAICTHQACRLGLDAPRDLLVCPCHGATFALTGINLAHPERTVGPLPPLPRLPVREQEGRIEVYAPPPDR